MALQRAARRAHELAHQTGTAVVISRDGVVQYVQPKPPLPATLAQQVSAGYKPKPKPKR